MRDFDYARPQTLAEAMMLLREHAGAARPLAGGTDLIDHVRTGRLSPDLLIDIKRIPELNELTLNENGLTLGAAVPCHRIYEHPELPLSYAALADSCRIIGGVQIQNRATVGGNLCNSGPAADSIPSLIALGAECLIAGPAGTRRLPVEQFCTSPGRNVLQPGELLLQLLFPPRPAHSGSHYRRFIPRNEMDIAVVGVAAAVTLNAAGTHFESVRLGLGAVAPTPLAVPDVCATLAGQPANEATLREAADAVRQRISPIDDMRGTREFRLHVTGVLTQRVLQAAIDQARSA